MTLNSKLASIGTLLESLRSISDPLSHLILIATPRGVCHNV